MAAGMDSDNGEDDAADTPDKGSKRWVMAGAHCEMADKRLPQMIACCRKHVDKSKSKRTCFVFYFCPRFFQGRLVETLFSDCFERHEVGQGLWRWSFQPSSKHHIKAARP
eukprot:2974526-Amphidinium_carterae.1